jgi:hypothetical protein
MYLSTEEVKSIKKVLDYVVDSEAESYERFIAEGNNPEKHVYHHANMMIHILELKKDLPDVKLTGDLNNLFGEGEKNGKP